jgi:hypothetical protein
MADLVTWKESAEPFTAKLVTYSGYGRAIGNGSWRVICDWRLRLGEVKLGSRVGHCDDADADALVRRWRIRIRIQSRIDGGLGTPPCQLPEESFQYQLYRPL